MNLNAMSNPKNATPDAIRKGKYSPKLDTAPPIGARAIGMVNNMAPAYVVRVRRRSDSALVTCGGFQIVKSAMYANMIGKVPPNNPDINFPATSHTYASPGNTNGNPRSKYATIEPAIDR
jgi:hypothetical protein